MEAYFFGGDGVLGEFAVAELGDLAGAGKGYLV